MRRGIATRAAVDQRRGFFQSTRTSRLVVEAERQLIVALAADHQRRNDPGATRSNTHVGGDSIHALLAIESHPQCAGKRSATVIETSGTNPALPPVLPPKCPPRGQ